MSAVATAIGTSAVLSYDASRRGARAAERGAQAGIRAEEGMSARNLEFQESMEEQQRADFAPWREAGETALGQIMEGIETGAFEVGDIDVTKDPGYTFRLAEGMKALEASASARGRTVSGAQEKAITKYGQDYASNEFARAYAREADAKARRFNILSGISIGGQSSAAKQAQATSQLAQTGGNIMATSGRAQNIMRQDVGRVRQGAYQDQAQILNQAAQNWLTYRGAQAAPTPAPAQQWT